MKVYLVNNETNELINTYDNVIAWDYNSVTYNNGGSVGKTYCSEYEHFTDEYNEQDS